MTQSEEDKQINQVWQIACDKPLHTPTLTQ